MRLWLSFFLLLPASCMNNNGIPSDVIKPVEMQHVMWDMICADNLAQEQANKDSTLNLRHQNIQLLNEVFAIHRIKRSEFDRSLLFYQNHPDMMRTILDSIRSQQVGKKYTVPQPKQPHMQPKVIRPSDAE